MAWFGRKTATPRADVPRYLAPATGDVFLVSGVTYRQAALRKAGERTHTFRLVCEPTNPHDPEAVAVYCLGQHIGYVSAKVARRYGQAVRRIEATGTELWVHGGIEGGGRAGLRAWIDCPWPEDL